MEWYKVKIEEKKLKELSKRNNYLGFFYISLHLSLVFCSGYLVFFSLEENLYALLPFTLFIHGTFVSFLGWAGAGHELSHNTVFDNKFLNKFFISLFNTLTWDNKVLFVKSHSRHHKYTLLEGKDGEVAPGSTYKVKDFLYGVTFNLYVFKRKLYAHYNNCIGNITGDWAINLFPEENKLGRKKMKNWSLWIISFHLLSALFFISIGRWEFILIINLASFFGNMLPNMLAIGQHSNLPGGSYDFRKNSRTIILNKFIAFLYWNMNYHIEHHMYPNIPFYNLPKLRKIIGHELPEPVYGLLGTIKVIR